ncbi:MAG TPA: ABC transporter ATP-binding protein [Termitinemataceae bacterium]|nr:ABC transporter ATP-binding protein [Termitinemataceae bacterium]HOM22480.1 ABC transporter ATP-binding protein [Termitinemataceae bacterium]
MIVSKLRKIVDPIHTTLSFFEKEDKIKLSIIFILMFFSALIEMVGIGSILPFITILSNPESIHTNELLRFLYQFLHFSAVSSFIVFLGLAFVFFILLSNVSKALITYVAKKFTLLRIHKLSVKLLTKYLYAPYEFFVTHNSSELLRNIQKEVNNIVGNVLNPFMDIISRGLISLLLITLLVMVNPLIALVTAVVIIGSYSILYTLIRKTIERLGRERLVVEGKSTKALLEAFGGIKDIQILGREYHFIEDFSVPTKQYALSYAINELLSDLPKYILETLIFGLMVLFATFYFLLVKDFSTILQTFTLFALAGYRLMPSIQSVFRSIASLNYFTSSVDTLKEHFRMPIYLPAPEKGETKLRLRKEIRLTNISFRYATASEALFQNINMTIPAHSTIGIAGRTGSGKSTLVDIIIGLLRPQEGTILIDDTPLSENNIRSWRRNIGYVPQFIFLSDDTVRHNIAFGFSDTEIDNGAVERAAKMAHIHDFIVNELPQGYDTIIGERGVRLSGGQRQRLGIARALYHEPEILIFDEATSALDTITERAILEAIEELQHSKTIIIIAHRLTTIEKCDRIYLLEQGKIVAEGNYTELLTNRAFKKYIESTQHQETKQ